MTNGGQAKARPATILVAEDNRVVRRLIVAVLRSCGYLVLEAASAGEAIALFEANGCVDLLLTDVVLSSTRGEDLAAQLLAACPGLAVLYTSGYPDAVAEPGADFLAKPFTAADLESRVRDALRKRNPD